MHDGHDADSQSVLSTRTAEIIVAILFLAASAIVITDSVRVGAGWVEPEGPQAGYFPLRIGIVMAVASVVIFLQSVLKGSGLSRSFVERGPLKQVLLILVPAVAYVAFIDYLGIYVMSAIYIALFMLYIGRYGISMSVAVGAGISVALFLMFEVWFLVPLPKGPLEELLGF